MKKQITVPFQVTTWEAETYGGSEGVSLQHVLVRKTLEAPMAGSSEGRLLMCASEDGGAAYTIVDRFEVEIDGRKGSFVALHGGFTDEMRAHGRIAPGSGRGELAGITGELEFKSDADGKRIEFSYSLGEEQQNAS